MNDDVSVDCDAMDRVDELANLFRVDLENESLRIAKARAASNGEPVCVTLWDVNAAAAKMAADRAATKPLVEAACKWCEAYDKWWRTVGDKPYDEQLSSMEIAALNCVKAACREVYEASNDTNEKE